MGAPRACFVDRDRRSAVLVSGFLRVRGAQGRADVLTGDVERLFPPSGARPVLVFIDPPYRELYLYAWSWSRDWGSILAPEGMVFVESGHDPALEGWSTRRYGDSYLTWMRKGPG